jgi:hypothetical protein
MFKVRSKSQSGGYQYLVRASERYPTKYRWSKDTTYAKIFDNRRSAERWADTMNGEAVDDWV